MPQKIFFTFNTKESDADGGLASAVDLVNVIRHVGIFPIGLLITNRHGQSYFRILIQNTKKIMII